MARLPGRDQGGEVPCKEWDDSQHEDLMGICHDISGDLQASIMICFP